MTIKADHYLEQLESARCDGNWDVVPELVRKVRKHAPHKSCLALTTETECAISKATTAASRPSASATAHELQVETRLPKLLEAAEQEPLHSQDRFQAQVCIGWLHWVVGEYDLALERLPTAKACGSTESDPACPSSEWTHVCALKSAYLRANCLTRALRMKEALAALEAASPVLERVWTCQGIRKQLRNWSELFLTEYCQLSSAAMNNNDVPLQQASTLAPFRSWAKYWEVMQAPFAGGFGFKGLVPRRQIWSDYYSALSRILESDVSYDAASGDAKSGVVSSRAQLATELKHAEKALRTLLLSETTFPRADEQRLDVEALVKQVVKNWSIMCGRGWRQEDLGQGGRVGMSRGVLDILYSAATRTYHSTAILRALFIVHLSLAEFALAFKALDSYLAIVKKAKARLDKTGQAEPSLDSDEMVLQTMAQGVLALCRYGHREAGEKAHVLGAEIEDLLSKLPQIKANQNGTSPIAEDSVNKTPQTLVSPHIIAAAWQAIGLSHANWSRLTFEAASRTEIQAKAIRCLRQSLSAEYGCCKDVRSCFSLALLLAERRDITAAIELTKYVLMANKDNDGGYDLLRGPYWQERADLSLWHLLALLLSVKPDYDAASLACASALEQFKDSSVLFGPANSSFRSEHLNEADSAVVDSQRGLVDDMDDWEKETLLEIKTTQLSILELSEGPDMAVNSSYELLTLFTRLFGNVKVQSLAAAPVPSQPPRTSATFRSIRGSIFGLKTDRSLSTAHHPSISEMSEKADASVSRPTTMQSVTATRPAIQITEANGNQLGLPKTRRASSTNRQRHRSLSRRRNSLKKRDRSASFHRPETVAGPPLPTNGVEGSSGLLETDSPTETFVFSSKPSQVRVPSFSGGRALSLGSRASIASRPTDLSGLEADRAQTMPPLLPFVQLPKDREKARRLATLVKIWLTVAGFYRRAGLPEDSKEAIAEAQKLVQGMETDSCRAQEATASQEAGWAEEASIDDLWGDVWCELGLLALAQDEPYTARSDFELALTHCPNHATATVNLCNILLDIYSEKILPPPVVPPLDEGRASDTEKQEKLCQATWAGSLPCRPLGLGPSGSQPVLQTDDDDDDVSQESSKVDKLPAPYKATHLPLADRLAARDRAFTLLSGLTRLGSGWNDSEAWFALARAYEDSGQADKAKEVLWWCVELEEARGVRAWRCVGNGGYIV
ncbi:hypothetical protein CDD81_6877 [Ophiocordyceps australis]|uniref:Filamentation protein n=1 Tax=Ophiocordyceps australis TaxID=1399860 RepID=A0A2C5Y5P7_9HYPO|nr:hypothetical protein CDD81_6877 [Ophiocordyceps australis]